MGRRPYKNIQMKKGVKIMDKSEIKATDWQAVEEARPTVAELCRVIVANEQKK